MEKNMKKGFSLIELIIVLAIAASLITLAASLARDSLTDVDISGFAKNTQDLAEATARLKESSKDAGGLYYNSWGANYSTLKNNSDLDPKMFSATGIKIGISTSDVVITNNAGNNGFIIKITNIKPKYCYKYVSLINGPSIKTITGTTPATIIKASNSGMDIAAVTTFCNSVVAASELDIEYLDQ